MFFSIAIPGILPAWPRTGSELEVSPVTGEMTAEVQKRVRASMKGKDTSGHIPAVSSTGDDFAALYEKYRRPIHSYIYRLLGSQEDANDVTQEVFIRAYSSWNELYDHEHLSPWLYRIATNLCVDLLRRRKRISWWPLVRRTPGQQFEHATEEEASYLPLDSGGIPEVFERDHIRLALAKLPEDYAIVLVLNAAQGLSYQDIATIVGISPNAAATRISRAKRMFAEQYQLLNEEQNQREERR